MQGGNSKAAAKQSYKDDLEDRLAAAGLAIKHVAADGNCWFRSLADQLQVGFTADVCRVNVSISLGHSHPAMDSIRMLIYAGQRELAPQATKGYC